MSKTIIFIFLSFSIICLSAQTKQDSLLQFLKVDHDYHSSKSSFRKGSGYSNGILLTLTKKEKTVIKFDSVVVYMSQDCFDEMDYTQCGQVYIQVQISKDENLSVTYKTHKSSNQLQVFKNDVLYTIGNLNFDTSLKPNLIKGISFSYAYKDNKKYLNIKIEKRVKLYVDQSGTKFNEIRKAKHLSFKQTGKLYRPINILPGSFIDICISEK